MPITGTVLCTGSVSASLSSLPTGNHSLCFPRGSEHGYYILQVIPSPLLKLNVCLPPLLGLRLACLALAQIWHSTACHRQCESFLPSTMMTTPSKVRIRYEGCDLAPRGTAKSLWVEKLRQTNFCPRVAEACSTRQ